MAQKVQILLIDDLSGDEANETITFALDGKAYEIDLSTKNAKKLRDALDPYAKAGRKTGGRSTTNRPKVARTGNSGPSTADIRDWAKANGYSINLRGRVPANIREAHERAMAA
ncbi:Lsr2 family protein [Streptomyces sp. H27-C3]|uniref:histone-like nucleoid-structuring protein Lsr2 n=1 Tax=Streptomyces sp. H27-C3 TaxID=3046305 RepID=UPI0024BB6F11|nr:Lsr2 family protein [Streptomyces sp. H27-C3]MDJ0463065.1 Lsr2 family protein [Streptomyces sp. H27-C3]